MIINYKHRITTQQGKIVDASAPVIISASRSTDIPAFYSDWFINRLRNIPIVTMEKPIQSTAHIHFFQKHESNCVLD